MGKVPMMGGMPLSVLGSVPSFGVLFENYAVSNEDGTRQVFGANWMAMIIKANTGHTLTGLKLPLFRVLDPGDVTVSIQALSGGDPDGTDLSVITFDAVDRLGIVEPPVPLVAIVMPPVVLTVTVSYAIVIRAQGDASNLVGWNLDGSTPGYTDGNREDSADSGASWSAQAADFCFEEYGHL